MVNPPPPEVFDIPRPPRRRLTRRAVAEAVIAVGFDRATLVAVAEHLGVNHATLYGHVANRDDMVRAGAELLVERTPWPPLSDDWRATMEADAHHLWRLYRDHPGLALVVGRGPVPPRRVTERYAEVAQHLVALGFGPDAALATLELVAHLTADVAARESVVDTSTAEQWERWEADWSAPLDDALAAAMSERFGHTADARFALELDVMLAGIAARLAPTGGGRRPRG